MQVCEFYKLEKMWVT